MAQELEFNDPPWKRAVQRSYDRYMEMKGSTQYDVIDSYRGEIDPDDWESAPLLVSYQIMNWAIKKINKNNNAKKGAVSAKPNYLPELLKENGLKQSRINKHTLEEQVRHAIILDETLHTFPPLEQNESMTVYRGESCNSFYYEKASRMREGDELVILPFLSTSINQHVAARFSSSITASKCLWEITVLPGQIFPYVSEYVTENLNSENNALRSEQEVLFPTHARLRLVSKSVDQVPTIYRFQLIGFAEKAPDFWDKTRENLVNVLPLALRRPKRVGGTHKANKTRKRIKNNRKSRRKAKK